MSNLKEKQLKLKGVVRLKKDSEDMKNLASTMPKTFENIEKSSLGKYSNGVPVSFYDLDSMTQGFQRGSLIVIGGRPSMGKTSFAMNLATNVAKANKLPVCYFSLEQSREQMSYRFLSMGLGIESGRLRTGKLQQDEWGLLAKEKEDLAEVPIFICDKGFEGVFTQYGFEEHHVNMSEPMSAEEMAKYWVDFINGHIPNFNKQPIDQIENYVKDCWDAIVETSVWAEKDLPNVLNKIKPDVICIDNVILFPATKQYGKPWVRIISCSENEIPDPKKIKELVSYVKKNKFK